MSLTLMPRLNYRFSLADFCQGIVGLFRKSDDKVLKEYLSTDKIYYYNHARTAMRIALSSLNLGKCAGIALTAYNCLTVFNAVDLAGYKPVFIDITDDFQIDMADFRKKRSQFSAVIVNHFFGIPCQSILAIKEEFPELPIIEDCAHSFGSKIDGRPTGMFGDFATFSYGMAKFPSVRDGGYMIVNTKQFVSQVEAENAKLGTPTIRAELKNLTIGLVMSFLGKPFIYKNITKPYLKGVESKKDLSGKYATKESEAYKSNKYIFLKKVRRFPEGVVAQQESAKIWLKEMGLNKPIAQNCNYFMLPVLVKDREEKIQTYRGKGIELGTHFSKSIVWAIDFGYNPGDCPNAEKLCKKIMTLPTYYNVFDYLL
jgi:dTDP-4-amino-4,6-dideoxygalactose transaminase